MQSHIGRRKFLHLLAQAGVGVSLAACGSIDRFVIEGSSNKKRRVHIIGGGLSGLTLAYHLKRFGIPYCIYEARERLGGRVQTLRSDSNHLVDFGAEFVAPKHRSIKKLLRELRVPLVDVEWGVPSLSPSFFKGSWRDLLYIRSQIKRKLEDTLSKEGEASLTYINGTELLNFLGYKHSENTKRVEAFCDALCYSEFGEPMGSLKAWHVWRSLEFGFRHPLQMGFSEVKRVAGGAQALTDALGERVAGFIEGKQIQFHSKLKSIHKKNGSSYRLSFNKDRLDWDIDSDLVIFALPLPVLLQMKGFDDLPISNELRLYLLSLNMQSGSKTLSHFSKEISSSVYATESPIASYYPPMVGEFAGGKKSSVGGHTKALSSLVPSFWGRANDIGIETFIQSDLKPFGVSIQKVEIKNWSSDNLSQGIFPLAQYNTNKNQSMLYLNEGFGIIGDFDLSSSEAGTMDVAVENAERAAMEIRNWAQTNAFFGSKADNLFSF